MKSFTKRSLAILIAVLMVFSVMAIGITSSSAAVAGDKLYLKPNSNWTQSNAKFAAYFFNNSASKNTWVGMTAVEGESKLYEVTIPDGTWPNVIFCRMDPNKTTIDWGSKWNQTADLTIPTDNKNLYTVKSGAWDNSDNNQWSVYSPKPTDVTTEPTKPAGPAYVYFVNTAKWAGVNVHCWGGSADTSWPGAAATLVEGTENVYTYDIGDSTNFLFNYNGDEKKTSDFEAAEGVGKYYEPNTAAFYATAEEAIAAAGVPVAKTYTVAGSEGLCGTGWDPADANNDMTDNGDGTFTKVYENVPAGEYEFKVVANHAWGEEYGNGQDNVKFTVVESATVTITFNEADKTVSYTKEGDAEEVTTEPAPKTYTVAGVEGLCGTAWDPADANNDMTDEDGDGVFTKVYEDLVAGTYQFKVVVNHDWAESYGDPNGPDGNVEFKVVANATVTITFDTSTNTLSYTKEFDIPEPTTEPIPKEYTLYGYIDGKNVACEEDWENVVPEYTFVEGKATATFAEASYVAVKTTDNADWYGFAAYCQDTTGTLVANGSEKMIVPAGKVEFTLAENEDGTLTLSYEVLEAPSEDTTPSEEETTLDTTPVETKTVKVGVIEWVTNYVPTLHYWNDSMSGDATLTATGETAYFTVGDAYWENAAQKFTMYTAEVPVTATGMKTFNVDTNDSWAVEEVNPAEGETILVFEWDNAYHNVIGTTPAEEPTEDTTPSEEPTEDTTPVETKTVKVGVIEWVTNYVPTLHYWNDSMSGDATLTATGETAYFTVGDAYWENAAQKFTMYTAEVPVTATGMKTFNFDTNDSWAVEEVNPAEGETILVFEWDNAYHNVIGTTPAEEPTEDTTPSEEPTEDTTPVETKTVKVGVIEWVTNYVPTLHYWNDSMAGDATLTATGETAKYAVGDAYWANEAQNFTIYTAEVPVTATGMKTFNMDANDSWAVEEVNPAEGEIILVFEWDNAYHNVIGTTPAVEDTTASEEPSEDTKPSETPSEDTTPSETVKNGIVEEDGALYYYVDGTKTYAGLVMIDGYYYYVNSSCKVIAGKKYYVSKTNLLLPSASYTFDETGKMVNPPVVEPDDEIPSETVKNGLIREDGALVYYVDGVKTYGGLIEINGSYYYVNSSCKAIVGKAYYVSKTNKLMERGSYTFGADGKMVK